MSFSMRKLSWLSFSFGLFAVASIVAGAEEFPKVPVAQSPLQIDGKLSEADWEKSQKLHFAHRPDGSSEPDHTPSARVLVDSNAIYVGFEVPFDGDEPYIAALPANAWHGQSVFASDYVSAVLDLGRYGNFEFLSFHVNAKGELYFSTTCPLQHAGIMEDIDMYGHAVKAAAFIDTARHVWTVELKIALSDVLAAPDKGVPQYFGMNFRSVQWGKDGVGVKHIKDWSRSIDDDPKTLRAAYEHMLTWRPFVSFTTFDTKNEFKWAQFVYPDEIGILDAAGATIKNKLIYGEADDLLQFRWASIWFRNTNMFSGIKKNARLERREDTRPKTFPKFPLCIAQTQSATTPPAELTFEKAPEIRRTPTGIEGSFKLSYPADASVVVRDSHNKVVQVLCSGRTDGNGSQRFAWDLKDEAGRAVADKDLRVEVKAGLGFKFLRAIDAAVDGQQDFSELLDVEHLPNPNLGNLKKHDHGGGGGNTMTIDRVRGEVYLPHGRIHDIASGEFKRAFSFAYKGPLQSGVQQGEISFAQDGTLFVAGFNELWHCNEKGLPIPFGPYSKPFVADLYRCHSNPHRGQAVGPNGDIFYMHHLTPHGNSDSQITEISPDGVIKQFSLILLESMTCAGVKVDSKGNIYVGTTARPADRLLPPALQTLAEPVRKVYNVFYGSIVKFSPQGGRVHWEKKDGPALMGARTDFGYNLQPCSIDGAAVVFPDYSPMVARARGDSDVKCPCRSPRFELDELDRLFVPDAFQGKINVYAPDGSKIAEVGSRGGDVSRLQFRWPISVVANAENLFVLDYMDKKVSQLKLSYKIEATVKIE
jgi:hypothetical protein